TVTTRKVPDLSTPEPDDSITVSTTRDGSFDSALNWETGVNLPQLFRGSWKLQPTVSIKNVVSGAPFRMRNTATNGQWVQQSKRVEMSLSARPDFFGFLNTGIGPFARFRHQVSPSLSLAWSPESEVPTEFAEALAASRSRTTTEPPRMLLTVGLNQNFQAKPRSSSDDTCADPRSVRAIALLSIYQTQVGYDVRPATEPGRSAWPT